LRRGEGKLAVLYEVVAEATSEEQVSRRRRRRSDPSTDRQLGLLEPDRLAADGSSDELVDALDRPGQEDERSYLLSF
jgi:hypothetical protein